ncbi:MAG: hypothetical protein ACT4OM_04095 [Actinomycetota bacterium]
MSELVEELARSLLYEGYALYPYTTSNAKNATPTPFGIVYPPVYATKLSTTYDHLQIQCVAEYEPDATVEGTVIFLVPSGREYRATEQRFAIPDTPVEFLAPVPGVIPIDIPGEGGVGGVTGEVSLAVERLAAGSARVTLRIENRTEVPADEATGMDRHRALLRSMISVHPFIRIRRGRFVSPLEAGDERVAACKNINSWPVLATPQDDAVLGAAIMLPEHPQIAPESKVNFFDNTEIEEALVLHAQTLSDQMLEEIGEQEPAVREMIACARQVTPQELLKMHGRLEMKEPGQEILKLTPDPAPFAERFPGRFQDKPPAGPGAFPVADPFAFGQTELRPGGHDPYAEFMAPIAPPPAPGADPDMPVFEGLAPMQTGGFDGKFQATPPQPPKGYEDLPGLQEIEADGRVIKRGDRVLLRLLMSDRQDAIDHILTGKTATIERILTDYDGTVHLGVTIDGDPGQQLLRETNRFMFFFLNEVEVLPK